MTGALLSALKKKGSALLLAGECSEAVGPCRKLALFNAGFAGNKFRAGDERAATTTSVAGSKLPAFVAELVFHGTDLRSVRAAGKVEPVAGGDPAG